MKSNLFFEIPDNQEVMAKLVEAVPSDWAWLDGGLRALNTLISSGEVEENTGFALERFHTIRPTIVGSYDQSNGKRRIPNLFAIMVEQKLPGFINFNEAGYESRIITLDLAKQIAAGFLRKGYRGSLHFFKDCYNNNKYDNSARCELIFSPWRAPRGWSEEAGPQPARVMLEWESRYGGGEEEDIAPIAGVCRSLNLREYIPVTQGKK